MNQKIYKLTREELYEAVWAEPMRQVAQRLGVSDVALSKACRRHSIPVPGRGYWVQLAARRAPAQPVLPELDGDEPPVVIRGKPEPPLEEPADPEAEEAVQAHTPAEPIPVPDSLEGTIPVVRRTVKALKRARPDERGLHRVSGPGLLQLAVATESLDRAARIADALVRACQAQGLMTQSRAADADFSIELDGQSIRFSITETVTRTERAETPAERRQRERARYVWDRRPQYDYHPTGRLTFRFDGYGNGHRVSWSDGKTQRLEDLLNEIVAGAVRLAVHRRRKHEEREAAHRAWEEAAQLRREVERQEDDERRRCERLMMRSELWKIAVQIREYVAVVERADAQDGRGHGPGSPESAWFQWATGIACQLDPASDEALYHATLDALWHVRSGDPYPMGGNPIHELLK